MNSSRFSLRPLKGCLQWRYSTAAMLVAIAGILAFSNPALAHHPFGGETPNTPITAFLSGMGHPVIGLDHLTFVVAAGLLAAVTGRHMATPIAFVVASLAGTGIHLMGVTLPVPETVIAASVLLSGVFLALKNQPNSAVVVGLAAIAGIFHGYAYGEAIVGAEMGPLVAYLLGFASIQMAIAAVAFWLGRRVLSQKAEPSGLALRFAGFAICGIGGVFLSTLIVDSLFLG